MSLSKIIHGDCLEKMAELEENSVHAIVCDPPYGLFFMGKAWDKGTPPTPLWEQALRVARPGAYLLAFGGSRTFHRLACAIEDAGWVLRDTMMWVYGSGFPKSHSISKTLDGIHGKQGRAFNYKGDQEKKYAKKPPVPDYKPKTENAKQWNGFGTALKPAWEPILLFQKPLDGTYTENVLKWGCGALNIDGCRIGSGGNLQRENDSVNMFGVHNKGLMGTPDGKGRWPANFLLSHMMFCEKMGEREVKAPDRNTWDSGASYFDGGGNQKGKSYTKGGGGKETVEDWRCVEGCPVQILDEQSGITKSSGGSGLASQHPERSSHTIAWMSRQCANLGGLGDVDGASRFFYCAKVSSEERNAGLEELNTLFKKRRGFEEKIPGRFAGTSGQEIKRKNSHPTVKPIALLRYLCRLVTPPNGIILDPFLGSGSAGCAAALEGFRFIGIEKEAEYVKIARARIAHFQGNALL